MKNLSIIDKLNSEIKKQYPLSSVHLTNLISESLDKGNFASWIFVEVFDTVDHNILLCELDHFSKFDVAKKLC